MVYLSCNQVFSAEIYVLLFIAQCLVRNRLSQIISSVKLYFVKWRKCFCVTEESHLVHD